jgi:uncharacterized protein YifN (PemK superfamily)
MHFKDGTSGLSAAHLRWVTLARLVTIGVVTGHWLVVGSTVAIASSLEAKVNHVWNGTAEIKTSVDGHLLPVFLGNDLLIMHNGDIGDAIHLVPVLTIAEFVSVLQHGVFGACHQQETVFGHHLEWINFVWVHASSWQGKLRFLHGVRCLLNQAGFGKTGVDRMVFPALASVVAVVFLVLFFVVTHALLVLAHTVMFSMALAHAHALMMGLHLLMFFG